MHRPALVGADFQVNIAGGVVAPKGAGAVLRPVDRRPGGDPPVAEVVLKVPLLAARIDDAGEVALVVVLVLGGGRFRGASAGGLAQLPPGAVVGDRERGQSNHVASFQKFESLRGRYRRYVGALARLRAKERNPTRRYRRLLKG